MQRLYSRSTLLLQGEEKETYVQGQQKTKALILPRGC